MKRSFSKLKYQKYHPKQSNWSTNLISRIDVGWIDFLFQLSQCSITTNFINCPEFLNFFLPFPHQICISSYFRKYLPNSSQTFQSFKISLIFLQESFKIRITLFSCPISCCFTLQTWKGMKELELISHHYRSRMDQL